MRRRSCIKAIMRSPLLAIWPLAIVRCRSANVRDSAASARVCRARRRIACDSRTSGASRRTSASGSNGFRRRGTGRRSGGRSSSADMATTGKAGRHSKSTAINSEPDTTGIFRSVRTTSSSRASSRSITRMASSPSTASITEVRSGSSIRRSDRRTDGSSSTMSKVAPSGIWKHVVSVSTLPIVRFPQAALTIRYAPIPGLHRCVAGHRATGGGSIYDLMSATGSPPEGSDQSRVVRWTNEDLRQHSRTLRRRAHRLIERSRELRDRLRSVRNPPPPNESA